MCKKKKQIKKRNYIIEYIYILYTHIRYIQEKKRIDCKLKCVGIEYLFFDIINFIFFSFIDEEAKERKKKELKGERKKRE